MAHINSDDDNRKRRGGLSLLALIPFLIAVFAVALGGTFLGLQLFGSDTGTTMLEQITVEVIITATTDPNVTEAVRVVTATPDRTQVALPQDILDDLETPAEGTDEASSVVLPTLNATALGEPDSSAAGTATSLPQNCLPHVLAEGDTPFGVAVEYDANPFLLLEANGLTEEDAQFLQIGDVLIVPLEGCDITQLPTFADTVPDEVEAEATDESGNTVTAVATADAQDASSEEGTEEPEFTPTPAASPTITLAPTAADAQIDIIEVFSVGDVTAEGVKIRNSGNTVDVTGWTLTDADGNEYTFRAEQLIFSQTEVTIYTRAGQDTPIALFWGLDTPVWAEGDIVTLLDAGGDVQATIRLDADVITLE